MPKLILDLDLTVFATERDAEQLHDSHKLSRTVVAQLGSNEPLVQHDIKLINPDALSVLIETACMDYDGIIILTAGCWHESVRDLLVEHLELSDPASEILRNCLFLSALTCRENFPDLDVREISYMMKSTRFSKYLEKDESLRSQHFVFVDDNENHILSFAHSRQVLPIYAATSQEGIFFYQQAIEALAIAKAQEQANIQPWLDARCDENDKENAAPRIRLSQYRPTLVTNFSQRALMNVTEQHVAAIRTAPAADDSDDEHDDSLTF
tara:strand:- start:224 stop:1024 length:801 start_codon:yes stop_codon:yes gene_type:complete